LTQKDILHYNKKLLQ